MEPLVPKNMENEDKIVTTHSLGLHDLYKAAFETENDNVSKNLEILELQPYTQQDQYQVYTIKNGNQPFKIEIKDPTHDNLKVAQLTYDCVREVPFDTDKTTDYMTEINCAGLFGQDSKNENKSIQFSNESVLDLDKGIPVHIVKVNDDVQYTNFAGDSQILQRYLSDSQFHRECETSNSQEEPIEHFLLLKKDNYNDILTSKSNDRSYDSNYTLTDVNNHTDVGVDPCMLGVRMEDCDFNSSDSFASTESIIPKNIVCPKCPKKFMFKSDLVKHDKHKHTVKTRLVCKFCTKEFASQQNLLYHEKSHGKKSASKCDPCRKVFKNRNYLVRHIFKKHSGLMSFNCSYCNKNFKNRVVLRNHVKRVHNSDVERPFKCEFCPKRFEKKLGLTCHGKCHTEETQNHVCDLCGKVFTRACYLKTHMKIHCSEDVPTSCSTCSQVVQTSELTEHMKTHEKIKPFTCTVCSKQFAHRSSFKTHVKKHNEVYQLSCNVCDKQFTTVTDLSKHTKTHAEKPYSCQNCHQKFKFQSNLESHWKKRKCGALKVQEEGTQTNDFELETVDDKVLATNTILSFNQPRQIPSVNIVFEPSFSSQPILLTTIGGFSDNQSLPMLITGNQSLTDSITTLQTQEN